MSQKEHGEVRSTSGTLKGTYHYLDSPSPHPIQSKIGMGTNQKQG